MSRLPALISLAALLALPTSCGSLGGGSPSGWYVVKSKRFVTYTSSLRNHDEAMRMLELQYAALSSSFFKKDIGAIEVLFLEQIEFRELLGERREFAVVPSLPGAQRQGPGQGQGIGQRGLIVMSRQGEWQRDVTEALAHLFIHRTIPSAPLWFHEGFAGYSRMAELREHNDKRVACFGKPGFTGPVPVVVPVERTLDASWDDYDGDDGRLWYKNSARMLIDFALHGEGGKHAPAVGRMVGGFLQGKSSREIMADAFPGMDFGELTRRLKEHMADVVNNTAPRPRGDCPRPFVVPPEKAPDVEDHLRTAADAADIKAALAALKRLPRREGFPPWFPPEIVERTEATAAR